MGEECPKPRLRVGSDQRGGQQAKVELTRTVARYADKPYRPCVGTMVLNRDGLVFIGRRVEGPEHVDATHPWQMPQGGLDPGEDPLRAALRELREETNIRSV